MGIRSLVVLEQAPWLLVRHKAGSVVIRSLIRDKADSVVIRSLGRHKAS